MHRERGFIMDNTDVVYIIGHRNPDMDSIAAALGYAWVLATRDGLACRPARAGEINAQTAFALTRFGVEPPELLTDAWMRVGQLAQPIGPLSSHQPLLDAARAVAAVRRPSLSSAMTARRSASSPAPICSPHSMICWPGQAPPSWSSGWLRPA
jgi:hypothetical protein